MAGLGRGGFFSSDSLAMVFTSTLQNKPYIKDAIMCVYVCVRVFKLSHDVYHTYMHVCAFMYNGNTLL